MRLSVSVAGLELGVVSARLPTGLLVSAARPRRDMHGDLRGWQRAVAAQAAESAVFAAASGPRGVGGGLSVLGALHRAYADSFTEEQSAEGLPPSLDLWARMHVVEVTAELVADGDVPDGVAASEGQAVMPEGAAAGTVMLGGPVGGLSVFERAGGGSSGKGDGSTSAVALAGDSVDPLNPVALAAWADAWTVDASLTPVLDPALDAGLDARNHAGPGAADRRAAESRVVGSPPLRDLLVLLRLLRCCANAAANDLPHQPDISADTSDGTDSSDGADTSDGGDGANALLLHVPRGGAWVSGGLSARLARQLDDPLVLAAACLPPWAALLLRCLPFALPLGLKLRWLHATSLGHPHAARSFHRRLADRHAEAQRAEAQRVEDSVGPHGNAVPTRGGGGGGGGATDDQFMVPPPAAAPRLMVTVTRDSSSPSSALDAARSVAAPSGVLVAAGADAFQVVTKATAQPVSWPLLRGLQVEASFAGELGSGAGPTAEFFSLLSRQAAGHVVATVEQSPGGGCGAVPLWRGQEIAAAAPGDDAAALPTVVKTPEVFFPAAVAWSKGMAPGGESSAGSVAGLAEAAGVLRCVGWACGACLQDGHLLDLSLAPPLAALLASRDCHLERHPLLASRSAALNALAALDPSMATQLRRLRNDADKWLRRNRGSAQGSDVQDGQTQGSDGGAGDPVAALELDWRLPGRPDVSLLDGLRDGLPGGLPGGLDDGADVDAKSLELWEALVLRKTLLGGTGVSTVGTGTGVTGRHPLVEALQDGASRVLGAGALAPFSPEELVAVLTGDCSYMEGDDETTGGSGGGSGRLPLGRDPTAILAALDCAHGYAKGSAAVACLAAVLAGLSARDQHAFLSFATGSPRLPLGGLASLRPRLTVVRKGPAKGLANAGDNKGGLEGDLPSVSTCTNYLKLPDYGDDAELLRTRLLIAVREGQGAFLLS